MADQSSPHFEPSMTLLDATMIVAGSMIGSGIFIVSADITRNVGGAGWLILIWVLTGFLTLTAALSYGELSAMYPKAGGQYVYLREAYNPLVGFLFGWSFFAVIQTGTIAAVAVAFAKYTSVLIPFFGEDHVLLNLGFVQLTGARLLGILIVVLLTYINGRGIREGKFIQTLFTITKILALLALIVFGFFLASNKQIWHLNWTNAWSLKKFQGIGSGWHDLVGFSVVGAIAAGMVGSLFSSDAWNNVTFIAGEIKNPKRNIGLSLFLGTLIVTILYVAANLMYVAVLPLNQIAFAESDRVAVAASYPIFGTIGSYVIAVMIMVSTFGCSNGLILSGARVYYTMSNDKLFFRRAGKLNKNNVPGWALWAQGVWTCLLCLSGKYNELLTYVIFVVLIFYVLTLIGIFILRKKRPDIPRPYKAFGYPVLPIIYCIAALTICIALFIYQPRQTWPGAIIVLLGIPLYYLAASTKKKEPSQ